MAPPKIAAETRYFDPEVTKVYFLSSVASQGAPTRAEIDAGTDISDPVADLSGWVVASEDVATPDLGTRFTSNIPGRTAADDSSLTFYADKAGVDIRTLLPVDTAGFVLWMDGGDVSGNKMDVFPVRVKSNGKQRNLSNEAAKIQVQFSITKKPSSDVTVPA